ncbi:hypothetical protein, partial [Escherichia coli]
TMMSTRSASSSDALVASTSARRPLPLGTVLIAALALSFLLMRARLGTEAATKSQAKPDAGVDLSRPTWAQRLGWVGLALVPSALLTAFTTHVSTDVASAPLIWVLPLTLYLLTF